MWIVLATGAALGTALWTALSKPIVQDIPPLRMMLIFRSLVSVILLVPFLLIREVPAEAAFWALVLAIGLLHGARWVIILHGVKREYFSTYGMYNTAPLFTLLLAPATLPERFGPSVWLGVFAIIGGAALFYRTSRLSLYGLGGAVLTALINILSKHGVTQAHPVVFLFLMQVSAVAVLALAYAIGGRRISTASGWGPEIRRIAPLTLLSAAAGLCFIHALWLDTATRVTAVVRTNLIFGFVFSYLILKEQSDWQWKLAGALLIVAGTVAVAL